MIEAQRSILLLHAKSVLRKAEEQLNSCKYEEKKSGFALRAYYLGRKYQGADYNPFSEVDHQFQKDMEESYDLGTATNKVQTIQ